MASDVHFVTHVCEQMGGTGAVSFRKMFGEYAIYADGKVVALVCDNRLFVKPTAAGKARLGKVVEAPPYPGATLHYLISGQLDDRELMVNPIVLTARELPVPKPKRVKPAKIRK